MPFPKYRIQMSSYGIVIPVTLFILTKRLLRKAQTDQQAESGYGLSLFGTGRISYCVHRDRLKTVSFIIDSRMFNNALVRAIDPPPYWDYSRNPSFFFVYYKTIFLMSYTKIFFHHRVTIPNILHIINKLTKE